MDKKLYKLYTIEDSTYPEVLDINGIKRWLINLLLDVRHPEIEKEIWEYNMEELINDVKLTGRILEPLLH